MAFHTQNLVKNKNTQPEPKITLSYKKNNVYIIASVASSVSQNVNVQNVV